MILLLGSILLWFSALVTTSFVVLYGSFSTWWKHEMGRHIFTSMFATAAVLDLSIIRLLIKDSGIFVAIRLIVFAFYTITMTWRLWILIRVQLLGRRNEEYDAVDNAPQQIDNGTS